MDLHIDDFFKDSALILVRLYATFPKKITLYVEDIVGAEEPDEFGLHSDRYLSCLGAMMWLGEEQHFRYETVVRQEAIDQVALTGRTFTLLTMAAARREPHDVTDMPEGVRLEHATNVQRIRDALKSQSSTRLRKVMTDFFKLAHDFAS